MTTLLAGPRERQKAGILRVHRPVLYLALVLCSVLTVAGYRVRVTGIFACPADGYMSGYFLAYCNATGYGDYDHGAFWFGLEDEALEYARSAQVLFLGSSRMQF